MAVTNIDSRDLSNSSSGIDLRSHSTDRSEVFIVGNFEHNLEVLQHMDEDSEHDDTDKDPLIYAATKKFSNANYISPNHAVGISAAELNRESTLAFSNRDDNEDGTGTPATRGDGMRWLLFRLLMVDIEILEISREEIQRVRVMHKRFYEGSQFSFNYNTLLIIASIIAALGLGSNSTATIIASMFVSPLMGPVIGMAYAATIGDCRMLRIAFFTESVSLLMCILVGAIVSGCMGFFEISEDWPTNEQESRATMQNFWVGIPIAFFSGLGVAVSVLDDHTSSLVGVAISASLLPPTINAGMLWVTYLIYDHSSDELHKFGQEGIISLCLTIINIVMIIISSMIMFRLKERLPIKKKIFWTDLGLARKIYRNQAILPTEATVKNGVRRMGRRVSAFVPFSSSTNNSDRRSQGGRFSHLFQSSRTRNDMSASSNRPISSRDIPQGSAEDLATNDECPRLSTVLEERYSGCNAITTERHSGSSAVATKTPAP